MCLLSFNAVCNLMQCLCLCTTPVTSHAEMKTPNQVDAQSKTSTQRCHKGEGDVSMMLVVERMVMTAVCIDKYNKYLVTFKDSIFRVSQSPILKDRPRPSGTR